MIGTQTDFSERYQYAEPDGVDQITENLSARFVEMGGYTMYVSLPVCQFHSSSEGAQTGKLFEKIPG